MARSEKAFEQFKARLLSFTQPTLHMGQISDSLKRYDPDNLDSLQPTHEYYYGGGFFPALGEELEALLRWAYYGDHAALEVIREWYDEKLEQERRFWQAEAAPNRVKPARVTKDGYIYVLKSETRYKIGRTLDIVQRTKDHVASSPYEPELLFYVKVAKHEEVEKALHEGFAPKRRKGEWFDLDDQELQAVREYLKQREVA